MVFLCTAVPLVGKIRRCHFFFFLPLHQRFADNIPSTAIQYLTYCSHKSVHDANKSKAKMNRSKLDIAGWSNTLLTLCQNKILNRKYLEAWPHIFCKKKIALFSKWHLTGTSKLTLLKVAGNATKKTSYTYKRSYLLPFQFFFSMWVFMFSIIFIFQWIESLKAIFVLQRLMINKHEHNQRRYNEDAHFPCWTEPGSTAKKTVCPLTYFDFAFGAPWLFSQVSYVLSGESDKRASRSLI